MGIYLLLGTCYASQTLSSPVKTAILCFHHPANNKEIKTGRKKKIKLFISAATAPFQKLHYTGKLKKNKDFERIKMKAFFFFLVKAEPEVEKKKK